ncbi:MAG: Wzz/FepE/Etk N-terminal domain-containing protein [bacterium]
MENLSINKLTGLLRNNSKTIFTFTALGLAAGIIYSGLIYKPSFSSTAKLMITDDDQITISEGSNPKATNYGSKFSNPVLTQLEIINSNDLAQQVWNEVNAKYKLNIKAENGPEIMKAALKTQSPPGTDVVAISAKWKNPEIARDIAQSYASNYINFNLNNARQGLMNTKNTIKVKLDNAENHLANVRQQIRLFKIKNSSVDINAESTSLVTQMSDLENKFYEVASSASRESGKAGSLSGRIGMPWKKSVDAVALGSNPNFTELIGKYNLSKEERASLGARYSITNPKIEQIDAQLGQMQADITEQVKLNTGKSSEVKNVIADPVRTNLMQSFADSSASSSGYRAESGRLKAALASLKRKSKLIPQKQFTYAQLTQEEENWSHIVNILKEKEIESDIRLSEVKAHTNLIESAIMPLAPEFPGRFPLVFMFAMLGSLLGVANGIISYLIKDTYEEAEDIEKDVNAPILGIIPWLDKQLYGESGTNISIEESASFYSLAYQKLLSAMKIRGYRSGVKSIAFTSTDYSKVRSTILMNVAKALSKSGQNVIIVDADFRTPSLHKEASVINSHKNNLRELLMESTRSLHSMGTYEWSNVVNYIQKSGQSEKLHIITNGGNVSEPSEFLHSPAFSGLIKHLSKTYDWVLIDMPPVAAVPDCITASAAYDGLILMTGIETTKSTIKKVAKMLNDYKTPVFGIISREKQEEEAVSSNQYLKQIVSAMMPSNDEEAETVK